MTYLVDSFFPRYEELFARQDSREKQCLLPQPESNNAMQEQQNAKVMLIDLGSAFGGAEVYLEALVHGSRSHVTYFALCANHELKARLSALGVTCFQTFSAKGVTKVLQLLTVMCQLPWLIYNTRVTSIQINGYSEILLVPWARLLGRKAFATRHLTFDIEAKHWREAPGRFLARALYRALARTATQVLCVSKVVGDEVEGIAPGRVTVVPNWIVDIPTFAYRPLPQQEPVVVLCAARLVEYKGVQVLLTALKQLQADSWPIPLRLIVLGDGPYRTELEHMASGLPVTFAGFQKDTHVFYRQAHILVSPSLGPEGSSLVAIEAMAHGLPVLLSDLPVHHEIAQEGRAAMLFRNGDGADLAKKLQELAGDPHVHEQYAAAGYRAAVTHHSPERALGQYLQAFGADLPRTLASTSALP